MEYKNESLFLCLVSCRIFKLIIFRSHEFKEILRKVEAVHLPSSVFHVYHLFRSSSVIGFTDLEKAKRRKYGRQLP